MDQPIITLTRGTVPLLISLPHDGSAIPADIAARMTPRAQRSLDTDWHVGRLYAPLAEALGASVLRPSLSRYVVDLNRPADGHALYPGRRETGLVPTIGFDGAALYVEGGEPDAGEIARRVAQYWQPYHEALTDELARLVREHGHAVLWEGHSIRSRVPMLFDGQLPDLNLGTADGASCGAPLQARLDAVLRGQGGYSHVVNGRFKGGYITRHYGRPAANVQAVQLELAQCTYMDEDGLDFLPERAAGAQALIGELLRACLAGNG
jgi:N-formylglutamate deformylase